MIPYNIYKITKEIKKENTNKFDEFVKKEEEKLKKYNKLGE